MENRLIVILCNLKPAKMRGIESQAMVLAATGTNGKVELIDAPKGAKPGDRATFEGYNNTPDAPFMNPKKKVFETVQPNLKTNDKFVAGFVVPDGSNKFCQLQTSSGVCHAQTVTGATIK